jgi:shikimate kinase
MTINEIRRIITQQTPPIIYISGKTSTGKSTFGRSLRDDLGYHVIELEAVLLEIVTEQGFDEQSTFRKVFYETGEFEEKTLFLKSTDQIISSALAEERPVVIEGAVANVDTLQRVLQPANDTLFLYFHPNEITIYIRNLTNRFMKSSGDSYGGLPLKFWQLIDHEEFKVFCKTRNLSRGLKNSIEQYAHISQKESTTRLHEFKNLFKNIIVVEIQ